MLSLWIYEEILSRPNSPWEEKPFSSVFQGDSFQYSPFLKQDVGIKNIGNHFKWSCYILKGEVSLCCRPFRQWHTKQVCSCYRSFPVFKFGIVNFPLCSKAIFLDLSSFLIMTRYTISEIGPIWLTSRIWKGRARGRNAEGLPRPQGLAP